MNLALACRGDTANSYYRAVLPMGELQRRGHRVAWEMRQSVDAAKHGTPSWDVIHIHQFISEDDLAMIRRLVGLGVAVVWDTDDDVLGTPKFSPTYSEIGGRRKLKQRWKLAVEIAKAAHLVTTPSHVLAQTYRDAGVERVQVIENHLALRDVKAGVSRRAGPERRDTVVIGYVAGLEHMQDLEQLHIAQALEQLLHDHQNVRVVSIGVPLELRNPRYRSQGQVPIDELIAREAEFDIGLAPLVDIPFNRARSNIKLKEYGAAGATWLASPVGPYIGMGEEQGGQLVGDRDWHDALQRLVLDADRRNELQRRAAAWAKGQSIRQAGAAWEASFRGAIERARAGAGRG